MSLRDWFIVVGIILIIVIILDGIRRVRQRRHFVSDYNSDLSQKEVNVDSEHEYTSELPNGGARIIKTMGEASVETEEPMTDAGSKIQEIPQHIHQEQPVSSKTVERETSDLEEKSFKNEEVAVDVNAQPQSLPKEVASLSSEPKSRSVDARISRQSVHKVANTNASLQDRDIRPGHALTGVVLNSPSHSHQADMNEAASDDTAIAVKTDFYGAPIHSPKASSTAEPKIKTSGVSEDMPREVIVINVVAKDGQWFSASLISLVEACGMTHGEMGIYHRNEADDGKGKIQFSMANGVEPGTFEKHITEDFSTPGVCFFMSLPGASNSMKAFNYMLETANCVTKNFGGGASR